MKKSNLIIFLVIFSVIVFGCAQTGQEAMMEKDKMSKDASMDKDDSAMMEDESMMEKDEMMDKSSYSGKVLAGTKSKYIEFNKADYDKALSENKKILLYFYASWCPICKKEQPETLAAFNELNDPDLIGFRVNYKDGDDDADEKALAQKFGVAYQHTKVILKEGKQVAKYPDSWIKQRYLDELSK